jgi:hypothetical protein
MPFCPNCKYEYEAGVERCADCGSLLVERLEEPHSEPRPEVPLVKLAEGLRPMVEMLADILRKHAIYSLVKAGDPLPDQLWPGPIPHVELWIRSDDFELHRPLLWEECQRFGDHVIWFPAMRD